MGSSGRLFRALQPYAWNSRSFDPRRANCEFPENNHKSESANTAAEF